MKSFFSNYKNWIAIGMEEIDYITNDFWNAVLKFVLKHVNHIYVFNIWKMLDNGSKYEMCHYINEWKKARGI